MMADAAGCPTALAYIFYTIYVVISLFRLAMSLVSSASRFPIALRLI